MEISRRITEAHENRSRPHVMITARAYILVGIIQAKSSSDSFINIADCILHPTGQR